MEFQSFEGQSGQVYVYEVHTYGEVVWPDVPGNYIFAAPSRVGYSPIYIGETDSFLKRPLRNHPKLGCISRAGGIYVLLHENGDQQARLAEETDLRRNYNPPCNEQ